MNDHLACQLFVEDSVFTLNQSISPYGSLRIVLQAGLKSVVIFNHDLKLGPSWLNIGFCSAPTGFDSSLKLIKIKVLHSCIVIFTCLVMSAVE
jgi:hypothetical protein